MVQLEWRTYSALVLFFFSSLPRKTLVVKDWRWPFLSEALTFSYCSGFQTGVWGSARRIVGNVGIAVFYIKHFNAKAVNVPQ